MLSQVCDAVRSAHVMTTCVLFVSSWSDIIFNPSADAITDHNQSAKNIDPLSLSYKYSHIHTNAYTQSHTRTHIEANVYIHMHTCIRAHLHIYTQTYTHTHIRNNSTNKRLLSPKQ